MRLAGSRVLLYGAGGVARAVAFALAQGGAVVCVAARRPAQARQLAHAAGGEAMDPRRLAGEYFDAIVNCTPVGMHPETDVSAVPAPFLHRDLAVMDIVYNPMKTQLLADAEARGLRTISGVEMFVNQAVIQFELWTGQTAPREAMRDVVLEHLRAESTTR